jgi:hypothetical protein
MVPRCGDDCPGLGTLDGAPAEVAVGDDRLAVLGQLLEPDRGPDTPAGNAPR